VTDERFNELLRGPLHHPSIAFTVSRLALALKTCVDVSPEAERALEAYCAGSDSEDVAHADLEIDLFGDPE